MKSLALVLALLPIVACGKADAPLSEVKVDTLAGGTLSVTSAGPTAWKDSLTGWRLTPAGTIGGAAGTPGELIDPQSLAVDDAGRIYVTDAKPAIIKVFAPDGRFLHTIGREGEGPGEFKVAYLAVQGTNLVVHDPGIARTSVFDTSGTFVRSWASSCCYYGHTGVDSAGRVYVLTMTTPEQKRTVNYVRYALDGARVDTVIVPAAPAEAKFWSVKQGKNIRLATDVPGAPRMVSALDPAGGVIYGYSGEYRVVSSATGRDTMQVFGRAWTPEPISNERRKQMVDALIARFAKSYGEAALRDAFHLDDVPSTAPAFVGIQIDRSGNRWLQLDNAGDSTITRYDVFDRGGRYLGPVRVGRALSPYGATAWGRDDLYAALESEEGTPAIIRFHLDRRTAR